MHALLPLAAAMDITKMPITIRKLVLTSMERLARQTSNGGNANPPLVPGQKSIGGSVLVPVMKSSLPRKKRLLLQLLVMDSVGLIQALSTLTTFHMR